MQTLTAALPRTRLWPILFLALLTALTARLALPLPFTPVPVTLQVWAVLVSGLVLGSRGGAASQLAYLAAIAAGAPLTAAGLGGPAALVTPTAGYLVAFVPAAYVAGWVMERGQATGWRQAAQTLLAALAGVAVIYLGGVSWLSWMMGDWARALQLGVLPFVGFDAAKAVLAALVTSGGRYWLVERGA
jgi:biotin transport system substrate-specific component